MSDDTTLPDDFYRELTAHEVVILTMLIVEGRTRIALAEAVEPIAHETRGDLIIDRDGIPAMLDRLQTDGLIVRDETTGIYTAVDDATYHVQGAIDEMRIAVDYAMQTGCFFTGWSRFALAAR